MVMRVDFIDADAVGIVLNIRMLTLVVSGLWGALVFLTPNPCLSGVALAVGRAREKRRENEAAQRESLRGTCDSLKS